MATRTASRPTAPHVSTNGALRRPSLAGAGGLGTAKRSVPLAIGGLAAVIAGALLFLALYTSVDRRQEVLAVARAVSPGQVISAQDLRRVRVSSSEGLAPVPVSRANTVVGKTAAVGLVPGTLVTLAQVGAPSTLQAGQAIVGIALKPGQAPASLPAGTKVEVVDTIKAPNGDQPRPVVVTSSAIVAPTSGGEGQARPSANGTILVSLTVPAADAPAVAAAAQDGQVSLVVLPGL